MDLDALRDAFSSEILCKCQASARFHQKPSVLHRFNHQTSQEKHGVENRTMFEAVNLFRRILGLFFGSLLGCRFSSRITMGQNVAWYGTPPATWRRHRSLRFFGWLHHDEIDGGFQNGWSTMENPIKIDDLGDPYFQETCICCVNLQYIYIDR